MEDLKQKKRGRDDSEGVELEVDLPEVKKLRENLLDCLEDESDLVAVTHDLDSFMKSFENEIAALPSPAGGVDAPAVVPSSDCDESRPDLGYLLEASDDELGLPPPTTSSYKDDLRAELERVESNSPEFGAQFWGSPNYDSFEFGFGEAEKFNGVNGHGNGDVDDVAFDGLFDHSDLGFGFGEYAWRPETMQAQ